MFMHSTDQVRPLSARSFLLLGLALFPCALIASTTTVGLGTLPISISLATLVANISNVLLGDNQGVEELKRFLHALWFSIYLVSVVQLGCATSLWIQLLSKVCAGSCVRHSYLTVSSCLPRRGIDFFQSLCRYHDLP